MDKDEFIDICSERKFWQWIKNQSIFKYKEVNKNFDKKSFLLAIFKSIRERTYYPSPPAEYLTLNKGHGVLRVIPVLSLKDLCVFYYCARKLEPYIALNHVRGTYGGFGLRGKLRRIEEEESANLTDHLDIEEFEGEIFVFTELFGYPVASSFNPKAWQAEWGDFTDKIYRHSFDFEEEVPDGIIAEIDISNFYDSIQLDNLEYKIRGHIPSKENQVVYLLIHFLKFWNRHINFYRQQGAGIPQDSFGECSRILANFYLQNYDTNISKYCETLGARYFRYADDQVIFAKNRSDLETIISKASSLLLREGLNFNQKKVHVMSFKEFRAFYGFDDFMDLAGGIPSLDTLEKKIDFYLRKKQDMRKGGLSLLKRLINIINKHKLQPSNLGLLKQELLTKEFLIEGRISPNELFPLFNILNKREKTKMLALLDDYINHCLYTNYLYELKKFYKTIKHDYKTITKRLEALRSFYAWKI